MPPYQEAITLPTKGILIMTMPERIEEYLLMKRATNLIRNMSPTDARFDGKEVMEVLIGLSNLEYDKTQDPKFSTALINKGIEPQYRVA